MRSEKEIRERIDYMTQPSNKLHDKQFTWELNVLQWVLNGDSEAVAKPLLADVRADAKELLEMLRVTPCTCHEGFTSRKLTDPSCPRCNWIDDDTVKRFSEHFR